MRAILSKRCAALTLLAWGVFFIYRLLSLRLVEPTDPFLAGMGVWVSNADLQGPTAILALTGAVAAAQGLVLIVRSWELAPARRLVAFLIAVDLAIAAHLAAAAWYSPSGDGFAWSAVGLTAVLTRGTFVIASLVVLVCLFASFPSQLSPAVLRRYSSRFLKRIQRAFQSPHARFDRRVGTIELWSTRQLLNGSTSKLIAAFVALWLAPIPVAYVLRAADHPSYFYVRGVSGALYWAEIVVLLAICWRLLRIQYREGDLESRRRLAWIYASFCISCALPVAWYALILVGLLVSTMTSPGPLSQYWVQAMFLSRGMWPLPVLVFVVALFLSIVLRGSIDPRSAVYRITAASVVSVVLAIVFIVTERLLAVQAMQTLGLSGQGGALVAMVVAGISFQPVRRIVARYTDRLLAQYMPIEHLVDGPTRTVAVAFSDLSGYTGLCARDERQGLLAGALLHREAARVARAHQGRLVRAIGDGMMMEFPTAAAAAAAMLELHRTYPGVARSFGIEPLPVHSGAHYGPVIAPVDNDLFGATVNLAARLQSEAGPGGIVVSDAFQEAAGLGDDTIVALGPRQLKNVPEPVLCHAISVD